MIQVLKLRDKKTKEKKLPKIYSEIPIWEPVAKGLKDIQITDLKKI